MITVTKSGKLCTKFKPILTTADYWCLHDARTEGCTSFLRLSSNELITRIA